jgi:hypothetical protein
MAQATTTSPISYAIMADDSGSNNVRKRKSTWTGGGFSAIAKYIAELEIWRLTNREPSHS